MCFIPLIGWFYFITFWFDLFLEAKAEILTNFFFFFGPFEDTELTNLYLVNKNIICSVFELLMVTKVAKSDSIDQIFVIFRELQQNKVILEQNR